MFVFLFLLGTFTLTLNGFRVPGIPLGISEFSYFLALGALLLERIFYRVPIVKWFPWQPFWISAALIMVGGFFSTLTAENQINSIYVTLKTAFVFSFWIAMGVVLVVERKQEKALVVAFCTLPVISSMIAVYDALTRSNVGAGIAERIGNANDGLLFLENLGDNFGRYSGILGHPNIQSEYTVVVLPVLLLPALFAWRNRQWRRGLVLLPLALIVLWANILTGSVTGLVSVGISLFLVTGLGWLREFTRFFVPSALIVVGVVLIGLLGVSLLAVNFERLQTEISENANIARALNVTGPGRLVLMDDAFDAIAERPINGYGMDWLTGEGRGVVTFAGEEVHNGIIRAWLFGGLFVFLGAVYAYWSAFRLALGVILRYLNGVCAPLALGLAISIIGWILSDMATPSFYQRFTWLTVALLYGLAVRSRQPRVEAVSATMPSVPMMSGAEQKA